MNNLINKTITVFGGSSPKAGDIPYQQARRLGGLLAAKNCTVITGGYGGTMEAVSRGAAEAGGKVIGVTCQSIQDWRGSKPNAWVQQQIHCETLFERLEQLITRCHAAIVLPGGPGTLAEIALTWDLLLIQSIPPRPLVAIGAGWKNTFETFYNQQNNYIALPHRQWITFAPDESSAVQQIQDYFA